MVPLDNEFAELVRDVRNVRAKKVSVCHSAQPGVDVAAVLMEIVSKDVYKPDYENITSRILEEEIPYDTAIEAVRIIAVSDIFQEG